MIFGLVLMMQMLSESFVYAQVQALAPARVPLDANEGDDDVPAQEIEIAAAFGGGRVNRQTLRESLFNSVGGSESAFQKLRRENILREIDRIDRICELTSEQRAKLNEAIEVDIQHISTKIETLLSSFDSKMTQQEYAALYQTAVQATAQLDNVTGASAIWRKVLRNQLSSEQFKKIDDI